MTTTPLHTKSESQLVRHLAAAVRKEDYDGFCEHSQMGVAYFNTETVAKLINTQLPLVLDVKHIPTLIRFMVGDDRYIDTVQSFLAEMTQTLATEGFTIGVDFSYSESEDGIPQLRMTESTALKVENIYEPHAWKQCLPYLVIS